MNRRYDQNPATAPRIRHMPTPIAMPPESAPMAAELTRLAPDRQEIGGRGGHVGDVGTWGRETLAHPVLTFSHPHFTFAGSSRLTPLASSPFSPECSSYSTLSPS